MSEEGMGIYENNIVCQKKIFPIMEEKLLLTGQSNHDQIDREKDVTGS